MFLDKNFISQSIVQPISQVDQIKQNIWSISTNGLVFFGQPNINVHLDKIISHWSFLFESFEFWIPNQNQGQDWNWTRTCEWRILLLCRAKLCRRRDQPRAFNKTYKSGITYDATCNYIFVLSWTFLYPRKVNQCMITFRSLLGEKITTQLMVI